MSDNGHYVDKAALRTPDKLEDAAPFDVRDRAAVSGGSLLSLGLLGQLHASNNALPPWWTRERDRVLRQEWKKSTHLSGAIYSVESRVVSVSFQVQPFDQGVQLYREQANFFHQALQYQSGYYTGWETELGKCIIDSQTQDNGGFLAVMADTPTDKPLKVGEFAHGVFHLESLRCRRTLDREFPVLYEHIDNDLYPIHTSRLIQLTPMTDSEYLKGGVGYSPLSRAYDSARRLMDVNQYAREKLGSLPQRAILLLNGIDKPELDDAIRKFATDMQISQNEMFSKILALSSLDGMLDGKLLDLASLPDGFNEQTTTTLAMFAIALAFGVDPREFWPATSSGATKSDAELQHQKARTKAIGHLISLLETQITFKVLPKHLFFKFDMQDDEQDALRARIRDQRSLAYERSIASGIIPLRVVHEAMHMDGELTLDQFETAELDQGRLPSGQSVETLFFSNDRFFREILDMEVDNPLLVRENNADEMLGMIDLRESQAMMVVASTSNPTTNRKTTWALHALKALRMRYEDRQQEVFQQNMLLENQLGDPVAEATDDVT